MVKFTHVDKILTMNFIDDSEDDDVIAAVAKFFRLSNHKPDEEVYE